MVTGGFLAIVEIAGSFDQDRIEICSGVLTLSLNHLRWVDLDEASMIAICARDEVLIDCFFVDLDNAVAVEFKGLLNFAIISDEWLSHHWGGTY